MTPLDPIALVQKLVSILKRRFDLFILPALILLPAGWFAFKKLPRKFKAATKIAIQEPKHANPFLMRFTSPTRLKKRIMLLQSIVTSHKVLSQLVKRDVEADGKKPLTRRQLYYAVAGMRRRIKIMYLGQGLVQLEFSCRKPKKCLSHLKFVFEQFMSETRRPQQEAVQRSSKFLAAQISRLKLNLQKTEQLLTTYKQKHSLELPKTFRINLTTYTHVRKLQTKARIELASAIQTRDFLYKKVRYLDPVLVRLKERRMRLQSKIARARSRYTSRHPRMRRLKVLLRQVKRAIRRHTPKRARSLKEIERSMRWGRTAKVVFRDADTGTKTNQVSPFERLQESLMKIAVLKKKLLKYDVKAKELRKRLSAYPKREQRLALLKREANISRQLYVKLRSLYEESLLRRELELFDSSKRVMVVEPPILPIFPMFPKKPIVLGGAFVASIMISIMLIAIAEISDRSIHSSQEAVDMFENEVIGSIGMLPQIEL